MGSGVIWPGDFEFGKEDLDKVGRTDKKLRVNDPRLRTFGWKFSSPTCTDGKKCEVWGSTVIVYDICRSFGRT